MDQVEIYVQLIEQFLNEEITVHQFEGNYLDKFKNEKPFANEEIFLTLDWLFAQVDAFTDFPITPAENPNDYINEGQLRQSAATALKEIREIQTQSN